MIRVLSIGVGIQSTALYYMASLGLLEKLDYAIFADTGGEKTKTLEYFNHLINWQKENDGIPLHKANYKNLQADLLNQVNSRNNRFASIPAFTLNDDGSKGMLRRQCTGEYKIQQVNMKIRELLSLPGRSRFPKIEIWQGITLDENHRMAIPQNKWQTNVYPFCGYKIYYGGRCEKIDIETKTRNDLLNWYNIMGYPIPEKSSCKFCPFQTDENWLRLKQISPNDYNDAISIDHAIRNSSKKGIKNPIYLHDSLKPLDQVNLNENQKSIWGNCTDNCDI